MANSIERGEQERQQNVKDAEQFAERRAAPLDWSGLSGPPGQGIGLPESRPPGLTPAMAGSPRLPRNFDEGAPPQNELKFTPCGVELDTQLGFPAKRVIVDNLTPMWAYVTQHYIPPWTLGCKLSLFVSTQRARIIWEAPPGIVQPANSPAGTTLFATYAEDAAGDSGGGFSVVEFSPANTLAQKVSMVDAGSGAIAQVGYWGVGDGNATGTGGLAVGSFQLVYNGVSWDRVRVGTGVGTIKSDAGVGTYSVPANIASSIVAGTLFAANANRRGIIISNDSTAKLYILFGAGTVSATLYTVCIQPGATYVSAPNPVPTTIVTGVWSAANGTAGVTEIT